METWTWIQPTLHVAGALWCAAVAVAIFCCLKTRPRSTATAVLARFAVLLLAAGLGSLFGAVPLRWSAAEIQLVCTAVVTVVIVVTSIALMRVLPRAGAFTDQQSYQDAARELCLSKERFERALQGSFSGLWEWNIEADTVWYSSRFRESLGYATQEEFPHRLESWKSSLHPEDAPRVLDALDRHLENQESYDVEYRLRMKSGPYRWFMARGQAIRDPQGRPYLMSGSIQDIHDRKLAEQAVRRRDEYLTQKQKMESLGELAGGTAHEFNNLLQAITGQIQFAERALPADSAAREELAMAHGLIDQSAHFTRQLLDFSRRHPVEAKPVDPNELISRLAAMLRPMLKERIEMHLHTEHDAGWVLADPTSLQQALLNLCINARDAMPEGGQLTVSTRRAQIFPQDVARYPDARPGNHTVISVRDTGCGMTEEVRARIFEPFFTTKAAGQGTGLGLAVAYSAVKDCGGVIDVASTPGEGSTFAIWLPVTRQPGRPAAENDADSTKPLRPRRSSRRATILYAEDEQSIRHSTTWALEQHGHKVLVASNGRQAVQRFEEHMAQIELALLDVAMPGMGGDEVFQQLRALRPELPVVFCSGYASQLMDRDVLRSEHTWLVDKPFKPAALLELLDLALEAGSDGEVIHAPALESEDCHEP